MKNKKITSIISAYKKLKSNNPDTWIENSVKQKNLEDAINISATAIDVFGKKHPHQYRIPKDSLKDLSREIINKLHLIEKAKSFDEIYSIIDKIRIINIGEMVKYDTALRIGAYLNIFPDKIYLHCGTRQGAEIFLGKIKRKYIMRSELPKAFQEKDLTESEIEDILCIYKDRLATCI